MGWYGLKYHEEGFSDIGFRFHRMYWGNRYATDLTKVLKKIEMEYLCKIVLAMKYLIHYIIKLELIKIEFYR